MPTKVRGGLSQKCRSCGSGTQLQFLSRDRVDFQIYIDLPRDSSIFWVSRQTFIMVIDKPVKLTSPDPNLQLWTVQILDEFTQVLVNQLSHQAFKHHFGGVAGMLTPPSRRNLEKSSFCQHTPPFHMITMMFTRCQLRLYWSVFALCCWRQTAQKLPSEWNRRGSARNVTCVCAFKKYISAELKALCWQFVLKEKGES